jgi:hypothetical protein
MKAGVLKKKLIIMACCCVCEIVERNKPAPSAVMINAAEHSNSSSGLPRSGM